jgi:hypothetical protein
MSRYSAWCGSRQTRSPVSVAAASITPRRSSSSHHMPGVRRAERDDHAAGERRHVDDAPGFSLSQAQHSASASTSRPSASVLVTSTVTPLRNVEHVVGAVGLVGDRVLGAAQEAPTTGRRA